MYVRKYYVILGKRLEHPRNLVSEEGPGTNPQRILGRQLYI